MKYVPDLIPKEYQVDINPPATPPSNVTTESLKPVGSYIASSIFLIAFLGTIFTNFWQGIVALSIGLILLPQVHKILEVKLRFTFTWMIKSCTVIFLFIVLTVLSVYYNRLSHEQAERQRIENERIDFENEQLRLAREKEEERLRIERETQEKQVRDTVAYLKTQAARKANQGNYRLATSLLSQAIQFNPDDLSLMDERAETHYRSGAFQEALSDYSQLIHLNYNASESYYQRANCYLKIGNKASAIADLTSAMNIGNARATKLYNQVNPLKRRVIAYITRCCDGSASSAKGRGACSHHRGVCDWNEPVYQEYRDYE